ncbi:MAG: ROK family transcriptional regulator [Caldilineaceae bacterium]|nr:ROK family transcriptional regulator [Caldilineaceae bacterium]
MQTREKATHQQTRSHNKQLVLRTIFEEGQISRADIARRTGLTPVTVSQLAAELIDDDLVTQIDTDVATPGRRGRNPVMLSMAADGRNLVALRIAVNEYRGAVLDLGGNILYSRALDVGDERGDAAVLRIQELLDDVCQHATSPLLGIGVAAPGIVDTQWGIIHRSIFFDWNDLPLGARLQERYRQPVHVANASQVAALAEYLFGGGRAAQPGRGAGRPGRGRGAGAQRPTLFRRPLRRGRTRASGHGAGRRVVPLWQPGLSGDVGEPSGVAAPGRDAGRATPRLGFRPHIGRPSGPRPGCRPGGLSGGRPAGRPACRCGGRRHRPRAGGHRHPVERAHHPVRGQRHPVRRAVAGDHPGDVAAQRHSAAGRRHGTGHRRTRARTRSSWCGGALADPELGLAFHSRFAARL